MGSTFSRHKVELRERTLEFEVDKILLTTEPTINDDERIIGQSQFSFIQAHNKTYQGQIQFRGVLPLEKGDNIRAQLIFPPEHTIKREHRGSEYPFYNSNTSIANKIEKIRNGEVVATYEDRFSNYDLD